LSAHIPSAFDGGNISVLEHAVNLSQLSINKDSGADFRQWFAFRAVGDQPEHVFQIVDAGECNRPEAWHGFRAAASYEPRQLVTSANQLEGSSLRITWRPERPMVFITAFALYPLARHVECLGAGSVQGPP
jgi:hypothetical protein